MSIYVEFSVLCDRCSEAEITGPGCDRVAERTAKRLGWSVGVRETVCPDCLHSPIIRDQPDTSQADAAENTNE